MLPWYPFSALSEELRGGRASSWWNVAEMHNVSRYRFYLYHEVTMLVFIWLFHINRNSIRKRLVAVLVPQKSTKMLSQRTDLSLHAPNPPPPPPEKFNGLQVVPVIKRGFMVCMSLFKRCFVYTLLNFVYTLLKALLSILLGAVASICGVGLLLYNQQWFFIQQLQS